jgi:rhodanese-related sulfurtransferase
LRHRGRWATIAARIRRRDPVTFEELLAFAGRHLYLSMALVGLTVALLYTEIARLFRGYTALRPAELTGLINRDNALVIDLSPSGDFEKGHIAGSRSIALSQFDPENKLLAKARELPVVVVCRSGQTSGDAAKRLKKAGFEKVYWLDGGVQAWQQADLPLVKGRA